MIKVKGMIFTIVRRMPGGATTAAVRAQFVMALAMLALAICVNASSTLACVVGTGTAVSCSEAALDACLPSGGSFDGTVTFNCGGAKTITLTTTKAISLDTTIDGGSTVTLQNSGSASFSVNATAHFTAENLTLSGSGDGIDSSGGPVTATNCTFTGNSTPISGLAVTASGSGFTYTSTGISADTVTATNCTFTGTGSTTGISAGTSVTATDCTFTGNSTDLSVRHSVTATNCTFTGSDGISAGGPVTATNCTFTGTGNGISDGTVTATNCTFTGYSTGISASTVTATGCTFDGNFDGISAGPVMATNCTFTNNSDDGIVAGTITVTNCTFTGNGIGIEGADGTITNTILANSTSLNCDGSFTDGGHNIDDGTTCGFTGTGCSNTSGTSFCNTNPKLDPAGLKNNGGPTQTIALITGSPAIDHGNQAVCGAPPVNGVDQRGLPRSTPSDPICDIGAFEAQQQGPVGRVVMVPAVSPAGLIGLVIVLGAAGWLLSRRRAQK